VIEWPGGAILLDVEGTTSAVAYVYDVMFPFAARELDHYVETHWDHAALAPVREEAATDSGDPTAATDRERFLAAMREWMAGDAKITSLKQLQGLIWEAGFKSGELTAHVYDDVLPALERWKKAGRAVGIYSSGSVHAQKLFFGHTERGDLSQYFEVHFDTLVGPKRDEFSYLKIADQWRHPPEDILFVSDVVEELDAARDAGMGTALCRRPGNAPVADAKGHPEVHSFDEITTSN
jgi:enolase-phosphatase E1